MTITFSLFVLQFTLLISIKSGDLAHLRELLGAWKPGVPTPGKACLRICHFHHQFPPSLPFPAVSILFLLFHVLLFCFFHHAPSLLLFVPISSSLHPCLLPLPFHLSLSDSPFSSLLLSLLVVSLLLSPPTDTQRYTQILHTEKAAESNCRRYKRSFPL